MKAMASKLVLELDDGERMALKLLEQSHRDKETVRHVRIEYWGDENGVTLRPDQYDTIFAHLGCLPNIQEAYLHFAHEAPALPVKALEQLIYCHTGDHDNKEREEQDDDDDDHCDDGGGDYFNASATATRHMEYLSLQKVKLAGSFKDFESFQKTVERNRSLKKVHLLSCSSVILADDSASRGNSGRESTNNNATIINGNYNNHGISMFLQALAKVPSLEALHLDNISCLSAAALTDLCQSSHLKTLELWNMNDINQHGQAIADSLGGGGGGLQEQGDDNHPSRQNVRKSIAGALEELEISTNLQATAGQAIINMLQTNKSLDTIGLDIDYTDGYGEALASVLRPGHNTTLHALRLRLVGCEEQTIEPPATTIMQAGIEGAANDDDDDDDDEGGANDMIIIDNNSQVINENDADIDGESFGREANDIEQQRHHHQDDKASKSLSNAKTVIQALERNTSLEHLHLNFYHESPDTVKNSLVQACADLLDANFVLKSLSLRGNHIFVDLGPDIEFRLRLNQAGRYRLLLGDERRHINGEVCKDAVGLAAPRTEWVETILSHQHDLSIVFYLLATNPSLCSTTTSIAHITSNSR